MASTLHWTSADLDALPHDEWTRYEIIGGELFVSKQPHFYHQHVCGNVYHLSKPGTIERNSDRLSLRPD